jgi:hypothetical protein
MRSMHACIQRMDARMRFIRVRIQRMNARMRFIHVRIKAIGARVPVTGAGTERTGVPVRLIPSRMKQKDTPLRVTRAGIRRPREAMSRIDLQVALSGEQACGTRAGHRVTPARVRPMPYASGAKDPDDWVARAKPRRDCTPSRPHSQARSVCSPISARLRKQPKRSTFANAVGCTGQRRVRSRVAGAAQRVSRVAPRHPRDRACTMSWASVRQQALFLGLLLDS